MQLAPLSPTTETLTALEAQALLLQDPRPYPQDEALHQLGHALMNEVLDLVTETALEDFSGLVCEALIGAFHSAAGRIERDADKARDTSRRPGPRLRRFRDPRRRDPGGHPQGAGGRCRHARAGDRARRRRGELHDLDWRGLEPLEGLGEILSRDGRPD